MTDWDSIYLYIRGSCYGADFPAEKFVRTPINIIKRVMAEIDSRTQREANTASATTARLCQYVKELQLAAYAYMQLDSPPQIDPKKFLPFPDWARIGKKQEGPSEQTARVLRVAMRTRELPLHVFLALINSPENAG